MEESHLFEPFIPENSEYLMLGTFTAPLKDNDHYDWYYCTKRNQFWSIIESVYNLELGTIQEKIDLFNKLRIALTDTILICDRVKGNSSDSNLKNITFNYFNIYKILEENNISKIFFTSKYAYTIFIKNFENKDNSELVILPSPSPRYARISKEEKIKIYKELLPKINISEHI